MSGMLVTDDDNSPTTCSVSAFVVLEGRRLSRALIPRPSPDYLVVLAPHGCLESEPSM